MIMPNQTQFTSFNFSIKWTLLSLFTYIVLTVIGGFLISNNWMSQHDISGLSPQDIGILMERDTRVALYTSMLGFISAIFCGWFVTHKTKGTSYKAALIIAGCLAIFGTIGIIIHPDHVVLHQVGKILAPFMACSIGAWIAILRQTPKNKLA